MEETTTPIPTQPTQEDKLDQINTKLDKILHHHEMQRMWGNIRLLIIIVVILLPVIMGIYVSRQVSGLIGASSNIPSIENVISDLKIFGETLNLSNTKKQ